MLLPCASLIVLLVDEDVICKPQQFGSAVRSIKKQAPDMNNDYEQLGSH